MPVLNNSTANQECLKLSASTTPSDGYSIRTGIGVTNEVSDVWNDHGLAMS